MIRFSKLSVFFTGFFGLWLQAQQTSGDSLTSKHDSIIRNPSSNKPAEKKAQDIFNLQNSKKFAQYLFKTGQYSYAAEEFQRVIFLNPQDNDTKYQLVETYIQLHNIPKAESYFNQFFPLFDTLPVKFQKQSVRLDVYSENYEKAIKKLTRSKLDSIDKQTWYLGLSILEKRWKEAGEYYQAHVSNPDPVYHQFGNVVLRRLGAKTKSPFLAGTLSAVVPGLGKVYTENYGDALMAFLFTGINIWQAYRGFSKDGIKSVHGWIFASLGAAFYLGNIFGSVKAAKRHNQKIDDDATQEVKAVFDYRF